MQHSMSWYMARAGEAVNYVKKTMYIGSHNRPAEMIFKNFFLGNAWVKSKVNEAREEQDRLAAPYGGIDNLTDEDRLELYSLTGRKFHAGNCGEQSALAFCYLRDKLKVGPLDWMEFADKSHAFVIIGRPANANLERFAEWTPDAVLCDPWRDSVGIAAQLATWYHKTNVRLMVRVE